MGGAKGGQPDTAKVFRIIDYRPNQQMLSTKFRPWHVEALLNQAADLIDRCLAELREYSSLIYLLEPIPN
jgi:hypothetical protein